MKCRQRPAARHRALQLERLETRTLLSAFGFADITSFTGGIGGGTFPTSLVENTTTHDLYGVTLGGGKLNYGTIFRIPAGTTQIETLAEFDGKTDGFTPQGNLVIDNAGDLFGVATNGGQFGVGTIWELKAGESDITTLWSFFGINSGAYPMSGLVADASGNLWGTTLGHKDDLANVFEFDPVAGAYTSIANFESKVPSFTTLAVDENGILSQDGSGNIFGTTAFGGAGNSGYLFSLAPTPNAPLVKLADFFKGTATGARPIGTLLRINGSNGPEIVGMTSVGGSKSVGTIFEATVTGITATISTVASFTGSTIGTNPLGTLIATAGVNPGEWTLTGISGGGGVGNTGTVWTSDVTLTGATTDTSTIVPLPGATTPAVEFTKATGIHPSGGLVIAQDGSIYVTTAQEGLFRDGTIAHLVDGANPADHFVFAQQPLSVAAGITFGQITVRALTSTGAIDTAFNGNVTLSILTGPPGASITGNVTVAAVNGVAIFPIGLFINQAGNYTLGVSGDATVAPAQSKLFTIKPGVATQLILVQQPVDATAGVATMNTIKVQVEDALGNIVTTDRSTVSLVIATGPVGGKLSGNSGRVVNGIATFSALMFNLAGVYTLNATDKALTLAALAPINVGTAVAAVTITPPVAPTSFVSFELDVAITDALAAPAGVGSTVKLAVTPGPEKGRLLGSLTAIVDPDGIARFHLWTSTPGSTYTLRATAGKINSPSVLITVA